MDEEVEEALLDYKDEDDDGEEISSEVEDDLLNHSSDSEETNNKLPDNTQPTNINQECESVFEPDYEEDVLDLDNDSDIEEEIDVCENDSKPARESKFTNERKKPESPKSKNEKPSKKRETSSTVKLQKPVTKSKEKPRERLTRPHENNGSRHRLSRSDSRKRTWDSMPCGIAKPRQNLSKYRRSFTTSHPDYHQRTHLNNNYNHNSEGYWNNRRDNRDDSNGYGRPRALNFEPPQLLSLNLQPPPNLPTWPSAPIYQQQSTFHLSPPAYHFSPSSLHCQPQPLPPINDFITNASPKPLYHQKDYDRFSNHSMSNNDDGWREIPEFRPYPPPPNFTIPPPPLPPILSLPNVQKSITKPDVKIKTERVDRQDDSSDDCEIIEDVDDYNKQIEEQKRAREEVLRSKEQRRLEDLKRNSDQSEEGKSPHENSPNIVIKKEVNHEDDSGDDLSQFKIKVENDTSFESRTKSDNCFKNCRIIIKNEKNHLSPQQNSGADNKFPRNNLVNGMKAWPSGGSVVKRPPDSGFFSNRKIIPKANNWRKTRLVSVKNLSSLHSGNEVMRLANEEGSVQNFQFDNVNRQANILFSNVGVAHQFFKKYNGFIVDSRPIEVLLESVL